ncbi:hypothetical protein ACFFX0_23480 [Citricoccus parietis]|uniref:Uncharacterized protein n=1 Tax=Citricoccus parietis TaxID=592307 RepID=A0ABV5G4Y3_9MICC
MRVLRHWPPSPDSRLHGVAPGSAGDVMEMDTARPPVRCSGLLPPGTACTVARGP